MCIIVVKPKGVKLLEKKLLENCFESNSDGAGFCTVEDGEVVGVKGFDKFEDLYELLVEIPSELPLIIHFRMATHGAVDGSATHPFPISDDEEDLRALYWRASLGVAHNGVITGFGKSSWSTKWKKGKQVEDPGLSDTQDFIIKVLSQLDERSFWRRRVKKVIERVTSSKFAVMDAAGKISLIGNFIQEKGHHFSNHGFEGRVYSSFGWDDDWDGALRDYKGYFCSREYVPYQGEAEWRSAPHSKCPHMDNGDCYKCSECIWLDSKWICLLDDVEMCSSPKTPLLNSAEEDEDLVDLMSDDRLKCGLC